MEVLMGLLIFWLGPILAGLFFNWLANKSRGRNARNSFRCAAWGSWLLLLGHFCGIGPIPIAWIINLLIWLTPSAICFLMAANHMMKEMRAQKEGEFTDAA